MTKKDMTTVIPIIIFICSIFTAMISFMVKGYSNRINSISNDLKEFKSLSYSQFVRYEQYNKDTDDLSNRITQLGNKVFEAHK